MILSRSVLMLQLLSIATAAVGPAAVAHEAYKASLSNAPENFSDVVSEIISPQAEIAPNLRDPELGVMQEAAHRLLKSPLWEVFFEELPDIIFEPNDDSETRAEGQPHLNWLQMLGPFYLPNVTNVSQECRRDVNAISQGVTSGRLWAQKVVDSWGKFPDGVLAGNVRVMGLLDECLLTTVDSEDPDAHFRGQYCAFSFAMKPKSKKAQRLDLEEGDEENDEYEEYEEDEEDKEDRGITVMVPHPRMANFQAVLRKAAPFILMATCIPSTCTKEEYMDSLTELLDQQGLLEVSMLECQTKDLPSMQYNTADIIMIITLTLMGIMVLVGTVADVGILVTKKEEFAKGPIRYFLVFSFYTNLSKIFHINVKENEEVISCLHGVRVLSMLWLIFVHSFLMSATTSANIILFVDVIRKHPYFYQFVLNAYPAVDTFFVMSGLLVAYSLTKEFKRTSRFNVPLYYIHRFIRLAPPIMLLCGFLAVFPPLFVKGPLSPLMVREDNLVYHCIKYWWRDSFFISNMFAIEGETLSCLQVTWYTSVDFQLYIVTPFMFLPLLYRPRIGAVVLGVFVLASIAVPMIIIGVNHLIPNLVMDTTPQASFEAMKDVYMMPWCRASPYLVGLVLGYFLRMVDKEKVQLKWWQAALGWVVALVIMSAVIYGLKDYNTLGLIPHEYDPATSILYGGLHRLAWGVSIAWLIFACHMGYGGPINSFLAHPMWQPLSRLSYVIYLISFSAQEIYYTYYSRLPIYLTTFNMVMGTVGLLLISSGGGLLLSLLAVYPVLGLEKLLRNNSR